MEKVTVYGQSFKIGSARVGDEMIVVYIIVALVALAAMLSIAIPLGRSALLGWYVHEVQRTQITESPDEAIVTYPLA